MDNRKIGVFDSGLGGLTVVREMKRYLPGESIIYFGDNARVPYGTKSKELIVEYSHQIMRFLLSHDVKAVIIACGTASSNALEEMRASYDLPVMGVVDAGVRKALGLSVTHRIGVAATAATVRSGAFEKQILKQDPSAKVFSQACPLFVPLVEEGWWDDPVTAMVVERYMKPFKQAQVDTVILGCTHYPLLTHLIQEEMGEEIPLINVSLSTVLEMRSYLDEHQMRHDDSPADPIEFYTSDTIDHFRPFCERVLHEPGIQAQKINIEKY